MKSIYILLPPSENKLEGGEKPYFQIKHNNNFNQINSTREILYSKLINQIKNLDSKELEKVFKVKDKNLDKAIYLLNNISEGKTLPSINRFDGVMFKAINYTSLNEKQKENFNKKILFIDGLFGLLKPKDLIPNYKLPIDAKLNQLNLCKFWKTELEKIFLNLFENSIVIDLLPRSHKKVLTIPNSCEYYTISFAELKNNKLKQVGHFSKLLKGELIIYLINQTKITKDTFLKFKHTSGYSFSKKYSNENSILYLKE